MRRALAGGLATVFALALVAATAYGADPPPNNDIGRAGPVSYPFTEPLDISVDTRLASAEDTEPSACPDRSPRTVWYRLVVNAPGRITVDPVGSEFADTRIALYRSTGSGGYGGGLANTPAPCASGTWGSWNVTTGAYYLQVADAGSGGGMARLRLIPPPSNDGIADAAIVTDAAEVPSTDTRSATAETDEVRSTCAVFPTSRTVWHVFTAKVSGSVTIDPTTSTLASPIVTVYRLSGGGGYGGGLSELACQKTGVPVTVEVTLGDTYYVQSSAGATGGGGILDLAFTFPGRPPGPVNDDFANAIALPSDESVDTSFATPETFEPKSCLMSTRTVWYSFTPTQKGRFVVEAMGVPDAVLALYYADGPVSDPRDINLGYCWPTRSPSITARVGRTYFVQVADAGSGGGALTMNLAFTPAPPNDDLAAAKEVSVPFTEQVDTTAASSQTGETSPCAVNFGRSVWYAFTPGADDVITIDPAGSSFADASLTAYRLIEPGFGGLSPIACRTSGSALSIAVKAGVTYLVQASDNGSGGGALDISIASTPDVPTAPPNDFFGEATVVPRLPFSDEVDITSATCQTNEWCYYGTHSVWYRFDAVAAGGVTVDATGSSFSSPFLTPYRAVGPGIPGLSPVLTPIESAATVTFAVVPGSTYYVRAADSGAGIGVLNIAFSVAPQPPNDDLADATIVAAFPFTGTADIRSATPEEGEKTYCGGSGRTVWYRITAPQTGTVTASGSRMWDPVLSVYRGSGASLGDLEYVTCRIEDPLDFMVVAGGTYYVQASDWWSNGRPMTMDLRFTPAPDIAPPAISFTGNESSYVVDQQIGITVTATDDVDLVSPTCTLTNDTTGAVVSRSCALSLWAWELGPGRFTYEASATDASGKTGTGTSTFGVLATYQSITSLTLDWVTKPRVADDLVAKLAAAQRAESRSNTRIEQSILDDYRALLRAQIGKCISEADAQHLISSSFGL